MTERKTISTAQPASDSMKFGLLLETGLNACKRLAGERWTDYNEHDPGVTILEQLCYAITDAGYRIGFPIQDLLEPAPGGPGPDGRATFHSGDGILSCEPVTMQDYQKLLIDRIDGLENAWLEVPDGRRGLYTAVLVMAGDAGSDCAAQAREQAFSLYHTRRNLGEDLVAVKVLKRLPVRVSAELCISAGEEPAQVVADVLFRIQDMLCPQIGFTSVARALEEGIAPEDIFDGPRLRHGLLGRQPLPARRLALRVGELRAAAMGTRGVCSVSSLALDIGDGPAPQRRGGTDHCTTEETQVFWLDDRSAGQITVIQRGLKVEVCAAEVLRLLKQRRDELARASGLAQVREAGLDYRVVPRGTYREPQRYHSIQHQFPVTYGVGRYGVPADLRQDGSNALTARVARARQLKAYLLFFEQVLANHFSQIAGAGTLFAPVGTPDPTYFWQPLSEESPQDYDVPDMRHLLLPASAPRDDRHDDKAGNVQDPWSRYQAGVEAIIGQFDPAVERRHQFLDHLLARFDERCEDAGLERALPATLSRARFRTDLLRAKAALLADLAPDPDTGADGCAEAAAQRNLGGRRSAGCDYTDSTLSSRAGMEQRLRLLLCVGGARSSNSDVPSGEDPYADEDLALVEHLLLRRRGKGTAADGEGPRADPLRVSLVLPQWCERFAVPQFQALARRVAVDNCPAHLALEVLWLGREDMALFRARHTAWRQALADAYRTGPDAVSRSLEQLDAAAGSLLDFLHERDEGQACMPHGCPRNPEPAPAPHR